MSPALLAIGCILAFASSWITIRFQVHTGGFLWPLAGRFFLGSLLLLAWGKLIKAPLGLKRQQHALLLGQALLMFSLNFMAIYAASRYLYSGLNSLICASLVVFNILNARLFLHQPLKAPLLFGSFLGLTGLGLVLTSDFTRLTQQSLESQQFLMAVSLGLFGTYVTSCGHILASKASSLGLSPLVTNIYGMFYGSLITASIAWLWEGWPQAEASSSYYLSLLYIASVPTALGFVLYLKLLKAVGPQRSGYVFVLVPLLALAVSSLFEGYHWSLQTLLGLSLVFTGYICSSFRLQASFFSSLPKKFWRWAK